MSADPDQVIASKFGRLIYGRDIHSLRYICPVSDPIFEFQQLWINDQIVNHYMDLLVSHSQTAQYTERVHAMDSHFWSMLNTSGYSRAKGVAGHADILQFDILLIPVHHLNTSHWCLAVIYPRNREIKYFDSLGGSSADGDSVLIKLEDYIKSVCLEQHGLEIDMSRWIKETVQSIPMQRNGFDCGVFVCAYAHSIVRNNDHNFNFAQEHMPYFRHKIAYEIGTGQILD